MKRTYEIYRLDDPSQVVGRHRTEGPEEAMAAEAERRPGCMMDSTLLTLIDQTGAYGVRAA